MMKTLFIGVWACLVMLASGYAMNLMRASPSNPSHAAAAHGRETKKTKEINVPKIKNGLVKGYIVAQLSYALDPAMAGSGASADAMIVDEAFQYLYSNDTIDFTHLDKVDLKAMTANLTQNVNRRLKTDAVSDVGVQEFTFVATEVKPRS